jgi:predicted Zn-dependent protease
MQPDPIVTASLAKAVAFVDAGNFERALQTLQPAIATAPDDDDVGHFHALILSRLHRYQEASSVLEAFPQPDNADWLRLRGHVLSALGQHKLAVEALEGSLKLAPDSSATYYGLGRTRIAMAPMSLFSKGKLYHSGLDYLRRAISLDPKAIDVRVMLASELLGNRNAQAEQLSRECLQIDFENPASRVLAAEIALRKGDVEAALDHAQFLVSVPHMHRQAIGIMHRAKSSKWRPLLIWQKFCWASGHHPLTSWLPFLPLIGFIMFLCLHFEVSGTGVYAVAGLVLMPLILVFALLGYFENRKIKLIGLKTDY